MRSMTLKWNLIRKEEYKINAEKIHLNDADPGKNEVNILIAQSVMLSISFQ